jgi:hypothetical protein
VTEPFRDAAAAEEYVVRSVARLSVVPLTEDAVEILRRRVRSGYKKADREGELERFPDAVAQLVNEIATVTRPRNIPESHDPYLPQGELQPVDGRVMDTALTTICPLWPFC